MAFTTTPSGCPSMLLTSAEPSQPKGTRWSLASRTVRDASAGIESVLSANGMGSPLPKYETRTVVDARPRFWI